MPKTFTGLPSNGVGAKRASRAALMAACCNSGCPLLRLNGDDFALFVNNNLNRHLARRARRPGDWRISGLRQAERSAFGDACLHDAARGVSLRFTERLLLRQITVNFAERRLTHCQLERVQEFGRDVFVKVRPVLRVGVGRQLNARFGGPECTN